MRLLQVTIPEDKRTTILEILDDHDLDYSVADETSDRTYDAIVFVPVETAAVERLLEEFRDAGLERDGYAIVSEIEAIVSERAEAQQAESEEGDETSSRISREELRAEASEMAEMTPNYVLFTIVSAIVAAAGLLADSAAVVVGSMVIAPLLGPAVGASVGSIVNDDALFREEVKAQVVGLGLAIVSALLFGGLVRVLFLPTVNLQTIGEIAERVNPGALSLVVALGAGAAGALSVTTGTSAALVGVMIAAALIPPAAAVGLGVAYQDPLLAISAAILVLVNLFSINFASIAVLWFRGYRPEHWFEVRTARTATLKRVSVLVVGILVLSSFLVVTTADIKQNTTFEATVDDVVRDSDVLVLETAIRYETHLFSREPELVVLRIVDPPPDSTTRLKERIRRRTTQDVPVVIIRETTDTETGGTTQSVAPVHLHRLGSQRSPQLRSV